jgi:putative cell wall-binding protein
MLPPRSLPVHSPRSLGRAILATVAALGLMIVAGAPGAIPTARADAGAGMKAVIIVGPTGSLTSYYKQSADAVAAAAAANGMAVTKLYTPDATWSAVKAATAGANLVYFAGHGNGFPNPYVGYLQPQYNDGYGLDPGKCSSVTDCPNYYGEQYVSEVQLAPGAIVLLNHLCYAPGASEPGNPVPSQSVAVQRADDFAAGFLAAGAGAVFASDGGGFPGLVDDLFDAAGSTTMDQLFAAHDFSGASDAYFDSSRTTGTRVHLDPQKSTLKYTHAVSGYLAMTVDDWHGAPDPDRYSGTDRYATAAAVAEAAFPDSGVGTAFVGTGTTFPDALAGAAAAGKADAPLLLTAPTSLPSETRSELSRLKPTKIVVLGGTGAVSSSVETALKDLAGSGGVVRLDGADRSSTAAEVADYAFPSGAKTVYVATGLNFPDALAGAAVASGAGAPVLLTAPGSLPAVTAKALKDLKPSTVVLLGGTASVSAAVASQIETATGATVSRWSGPDRYSTAVAISQHAFKSAATVYLATGRNFPDALAGAPLGGPLLLVPSDGLPSGVSAEIARLHPTRIIILGGWGAVSPAIEAAAKAAAGID